MKSNQQYNNAKSRKRTGIIITTVVHVLLVVFFILFGFKVVDPKIDTEISWQVQGVEDAGGENNETPTAEKTQPTKENQQSASASSQASDKQQLVSDEQSPATIKSTPIKSETPPKEVTDTKEPTDKTQDSKENEGPSDKMKNLMSAYKKGINNPGGNGDGEKKGTEGNEETKGKDNLGKSGEGESKYGIPGRKATNIGHQNNDCGMSGTIVLKITINQQGIVTNAIQVDGTTANQCLINQAKAFARQIKYAPSSGGVKTNEGTITIKYSLS
tara:strand:+ start:131 stop:946 length:816 start_codon:yes stop_codon:yes gene_type:complete